MFLRIPSVSVNHLFNHHIRSAKNATATIAVAGTTFFALSNSL